MAKLRSMVLVTTQFAGLALTCLPVTAARAGSHAWLVCCAIGGLLGIITLLHNRVGNFSVFPELIADARLITSGPYRWIRHPMYSALALVSLGIAAFNGHWLNYVGLGMVLGAVYLKAQREECLLHQRFADYAAYATRTPRFIPFIY